MRSHKPLHRRAFLATTAGAASVASLHGASAPASAARIRVAVIGCGSVSNSYLPHLSKCPHVELVSACDIRFERAQKQARQFGIPNQYPNIGAMLAGAPFDMMVNLTDMQEHEHLNAQAIDAGKHVWSEKPLANSLAAGQKLLAAARAKEVRLWGAPAMVMSPHFAFMSKTLAAGKLGKLAAAHAHYGHEGPHWSPFFYEKGGGSLPDLAVYNLTTLTGLLGPAQAVAAMTSVVTPTRTIDEKGEIPVVAEDNAMVLMDHGAGLISHVQSGFNYFNPHGHDGRRETRYTVSVVGKAGFMGLVGYDWAPQGVDVATHAEPELRREVTDAGPFVWQMGASLAAESLANETELLIRPEHALHVLEIIEATRASQETGRRISLASTFPWPVIS